MLDRPNLSSSAIGIIMVFSQYLFDHHPSKSIVMIKTSIFYAQVSAIKAFLSMQHPAHAPAINPSTLDIQVDQLDYHHHTVQLSSSSSSKCNRTIFLTQVEDYIAPRFSHKRKSKLRQKILEAHANVKVKCVIICM